MGDTSVKVLITGGAGFIGSNLAKRLLKENCEVRILDNFSEQIHGTNKSLDESLEGVELIVGDIRDKETVSASLNGIDTVVHLAAETGTGQSMYEIEHYEKTNVLGTLNIIEHLLQKENSVKKIVVASSRAIYGEGAYFSKEHGEVYMLGTIVHNERVVENLGKVGAKVVESIDDVPDGETLLFRAHGTAPDLWSKAKSKNINLVDGTCPLVTEIHHEIKMLDQEGRKTIIIGDHGHDEVEAIAAQVDKPIVIASIDEAKKRTQQLCEEACDALNSFGGKANLLKAAARFTIERGF